MNGDISGAMISFYEPGVTLEFHITYMFDGVEFALKPEY
jgi:hypothetical protein